MNLKIRKINSKDYSDIENIANEGYEDNYFETKESFINKVESFPDGALAADLDGVVGYSISFPYQLGVSFPINTNYEIIENPNCWYIHDVCVTKRFRKKGIATCLVKEILKESWNVVALTAVQESKNFWQKFGFLSFKELTYCGIKANYMVLIKS